MLPIDIELSVERYSECPGCGRSTAEGVGYVPWGNTIDTRLNPPSFRSWVACPKCHIVFPFTHLADPLKFYEDTYRQLTEHKIDQEIAGEDERAKRVMTILHNKRIIDALLGGPSWLHVLDVGCGRGQLIKRIIYKQAEDPHPPPLPHYEVWGYTPSGHERKWIEENEPSIQLVTGLEEIPEERMTLITCLHVLEHVVWPRPFLTQLRSLLAPGGTFVVEVPSVLGPHGRALATIAHAVGFTAPALEGILTESGFSVIVTAISPHPIFAEVESNILMIARKSEETNPEGGTSDVT